MIPPRPGPFRECRHLFARGHCRFHERARRGPSPEVVNFGGGSNPHLVRPAWVDAVPRRPAPPRRWAWVEELGRLVGRWVRAAMADQEPFSSPWMASEAIPGGEPLWPGP